MVAAMAGSKAMSRRLLAPPSQPHSPVCTHTGLEGKVMLQNLPSLVAAMALAPRPGSRVLDMCAAPGGKVGGR